MRLTMNLSLLSLLHCSRCHSPLDAEGDPTDRLTCRSCGTSFPIERGVPRLAGETYTASFGRQWNRYDVARPEEDEATFRVKTGVDPRELAGRLVLDAGCGGGRYARLLGQHGARVLGIDLSSAVDKAAELCADYPELAIVQGDLLDLPVADESFDLVYSIGVLHHTPDPRRAFAQIARRVKPGGRLAVWLYRRNTPPQEWLNSGLRAISTRLPAPVLEPICAGLGALGSIPLMNRTLNKLANFSSHPDWTLRICDNFDWYAPHYQSHHTPAELRGWFEEEGFADIHELAPARHGRLYDWTYRHDLIIGSGVNFFGVRH